jgi:hypothetical protein
MLKTKPSNPLRLLGFDIEFGCGDMQPSQIALRGRGLLIAAIRAPKRHSIESGACAVVFLRPERITMFVDR